MPNSETISKYFKAASKWGLANISTIFSNLLEMLKDYKYQISFARLSGLFCIIIATSLAYVGIFYAKADRSFISNAIFQFLGTATLLYGVSKATEVKAIDSTKIIPGISSSQEDKSKVIETKTSESKTEEQIG